MLSLSHSAQLIVGLLKCALLFGAGAYLAWLWPRRVVVRSNRTPSRSSRVGRSSAVFASAGYLVMVLAALFAIGVFLGNAHSF